MENTTYIGLTRQIGLRRKLEIAANNLANANTDGFKADRARFYDLVVRLREEEPLAFNSTLNISRDHREGPVRVTGNPLDAAIQGEGYFSVRTEQGDLYTRLGRFAVNTNNELVTPNGDSVLNSAGQPVLLPLFSEVISIANDGLVIADGDQIDQIGIYVFEDEQRLEKLADNYYRAGENMVAQVKEEGGLIQGALEGSNVNAVTELVDLISIQRSYSSMAKLMELEDQRGRNAITQLTRRG